MALFSGSGPLNSSSLFTSQGPAIFAELVTQKHSSWFCLVGFDQGLSRPISLQTFGLLSTSETNNMNWPTGKGHETELSLVLGVKPVSPLFMGQLFCEFSHNIENGKWS